MKKKQVEHMIIHQQEEGISNQRIAQTIRQGEWAGYIRPEVAEEECRRLGYPLTRKERNLAQSHIAHLYINANLQKAEAILEASGYAE
jgi:DNA-binding HxlR family transcriptional regulator